MTGCMYPGCGGMAPMSIRNSLQSPVSSLSMSVSASAMSSVATSPHSSLSLTSDHEQSFSPASGQLMHNLIIKSCGVQDFQKTSKQSYFQLFPASAKVFPVSQASPGWGEWRRPRAGACWADRPPPAPPPASPPSASPRSRWPACVRSSSRAGACSGLRG